MTTIGHHEVNLGIDYIRQILKAHSSAYRNGTVQT